MASLLTNQSSFNLCFRDLIQHRERHQGRWPTKSSNKKLYQWIAKQRAAFRRGSLTLEHIDMLDSIHFPWTMIQTARRKTVEESSTDSDSDGEEPMTHTSWWNTTEEHTHGRGGVGLVKRCMRVYGWKEEKAKQILWGYRQFLELKCILRDWNATLLSPSIPVDKMWHQHILDTQNYVNDCKLLCNGHVIHHDPNGDLDQGARSIRVDRTKKMLESQFGKAAIDGSVWTFCPCDDMASAGLSRRRDESPPTRSDSITLHFRDNETGGITILKEKRNAQMKKLFHSYIQNNNNSNVPLGSLQFFCGSEIIDATLTPDAYSLQEKDVITVKAMSKEGKSERITVIIRDMGGYEVSFNMLTTTPMRKIFRLFAQRIRVSVLRIRFLFEGEAIKDSATPRMCGMEDNARIDASIVQVGC